MADQREADILDGIKSVISKHLGERKITLFGSRAKGTNRYSSDFDVVVEGRRPDPLTSSKIRDDLEKIAGLYTIDVVYSDELEDDFRGIVNKTGRVIT